MSFSAKLGIIEPILRKLFTAIGHVFTAEDAELEHLFRRKLRLKARIEVLPKRLRKPVAVFLLHLVVYQNRLHSTPQLSAGQTSPELPPVSRISL